MAIEAIKEQRTISELAQEFEIHPNQVSQWKREFLERSAQVFEGDKKQAEEIERLGLEQGAAIDAIPAAERATYGDDIDHYPGLFDGPPPIPGAIAAIERLRDSGRFELYILSTAPWGNPGAWMAKRLWIERHFGDTFYKRLTITHNKHHVHGDFLVDDRDANGAKHYVGEWIHFNTAAFPNWPAVVDHLLARA